MQTKVEQLERVVAEMEATLNYLDKGGNAIACGSLARVAAIRAEVDALEKPAPKRCESWTCPECDADNHVCDHYQFTPRQPAPAVDKLDNEICEVCGKPFWEHYDGLCLPPIPQEKINEDIYERLEKLEQDTLERRIDTYIKNADETANKLLARIASLEQAADVFSVKAWAKQVDINEDMLKRLKKFEAWAKGVSKIMTPEIMEAKAK